jgi:hypothetical protein
MVKHKSFRKKGRRVTRVIRVTRVTRRGKGRSYTKSKYPSGSDNRQSLVNYCNADDWTSYENLVAKIIKHKNIRDDFFRHLDSQIHTFSQNTLDCLETCLTRLQEEAIPESNSHLYYIVQSRQ